jgi:hypothetical protein
LQECGAGVQSGQHVVQIVRDAGAQAPDRFEPLALDELLFDQVEAGQGHDDARPQADLVTQTDQGVVDPAPVQERAVLAAQILDLEAARVAAANPCMEPGNPRIVDHHGRVRGAADGGDAVDLELLPHRRAVDHRHAHRRGCLPGMVDSAACEVVHQERVPDRAHDQTCATITMTQKSDRAARLSH